MATKIPAALAAACILWPIATSTATARVSCADWATTAFFESATSIDISRCLARGANLKTRDKDGLTPLHIAAASSPVPAVVPALIRAGAKLEAESRGDQTPLHLAAARSTSPAVVRALLAAGADFEARDKAGRTPLHMAAEFSKTPGVVLVLLDAGANPRAKTDSGETPRDLIRKNDGLAGTSAYRRLDSARSQ